MKKLALILSIFITTLSVSAYSTDVSKYLEKQHEEVYNKPIKLVVKKEHTEEYNQKIGDILIPAITYGYGNLKIKGLKKYRVSYICLLDKDLKPLWGHIIPR